MKTLQKHTARLAEYATAIRLGYYLILSDRKETGNHHGGGRFAVEIPSDRITHTQTKTISRLDSPPTSDVNLY